MNNMVHEPSRCGFHTHLLFTPSRPAVRTDHPSPCELISWLICDAPKVDRPLCGSPWMESMTEHRTSSLVVPTCGRLQLCSRADLSIGAAACLHTLPHEEVTARDQCTTSIRGSLLHRPLPDARVLWGVGRQRCVCR